MHGLTCHDIRIALMFTLLSEESFKYYIHKIYSVTDYSLVLRSSTYIYTPGYCLVPGVFYNNRLNINSILYNIPMQGRWTE